MTSEDVSNEMARDRDVSRFAHSVAHELQTPLSSLTMLLSVLRRASDRSGPAIDEYLDKALGATERMRRLIRDLVDHVDAGRNARALERVDLDAVVREVLCDFDERAAACVGVEAELPVVEGDAVGLRRVFRHLLDNALRYRDTAIDPVVSLHCRRQGDEWELSIVDHGIGIPTDRHADVFEPLVRLNSYDDFPGSGLGLATCKRIVERHGGRIGLRSGSGPGTEVWFTLPAGPGGSTRASP